MTESLWTHTHTPPTIRLWLNRRLLITGCSLVFASENFLEPGIRRRIRGRREQLPDMIIERTRRTGAGNGLLPYTPFALFEGPLPPFVIVALEGWNGLSRLHWRMVLEETPQGGNLASELGSNSLYIRWESSPAREELEKFWRGLARLRWWLMNDRDDPATDLFVYRIYLRHRERVRQLSCYGFIESSPQERLVRRIERFGHLPDLFQENSRRARP